MEKFLLRNKNALITGASSGIGKATAELFSKLGANIFITGRNSENLNETKKQCEINKANTDQRIILFETDMSKEVEIKLLASKTLSEFKTLDILVNSAGVLINDTVENVNMDSFDMCMNVNVRGLIQLTNLLSASLIEAKGSIINISSVAGSRSFPNLMSYCISKAAVEQFTKCTALDLAPQGVRVNCISPGVIITDIHRRAGMDEEKYNAFLDKSKSTHAMGRVGDAVEVAYSVAFFASSAASFTTGASFPVDGGRHAMCPR